MSWEVFGPKHSRRPKPGPSVGLYGKWKYMRFNKQAADYLLAQGDRVVVWWDAELRKIAFSGSSAKEDRECGYKMTVHPRGGCSIAAGTVYRRIGLCGAESSNYTLAEVDGRLEAEIVVPCSQTAELVGQGRP